jgi:hypothetical protein
MRFADRAVPDEVWMQLNRGLLSGGQPTKQEIDVRRQPNLFGEYNPEQYELSVDFADN